MRDYLKRLVGTGAAYQFGDILAKALALVTLPLYTRHLSTAAYGAVLRWRVYSGSVTRASALARMSPN